MVTNIISSRKLTHWVKRLRLLFFDRLTGSPSWFSVSLLPVLAGVTEHQEPPGQASPLLQLARNTQATSPELRQAPPPTTSKDGRPPCSHPYPPIPGKHTHLPPYPRVTRATPPISDFQLAPVCSLVPHISPCKSSLYHAQTRTPHHTPLPQAPTPAHITTRNHHINAQHSPLAALISPKGAYILPLLAPLWAVAYMLQPLSCSLHLLPPPLRSGSPSPPALLPALPRPN